MMYVINSSTRGVASMVEAAHYIGVQHKIFLCVQHVKENTVIDGHALSSREAKVCCSYAEASYYSIMTDHRTSTAAACI